MSTALAATPTPTSAPSDDLDLSSLLDDSPTSKAVSHGAGASGKPDRSPIQGGRVPLYFDLETVPDESRIGQFGLEPLPQLREETPLDQCPPVATVIAHTVEATVKLLGELRPPEAWLAEFEAAEKAKETSGGKEKTRKGVLDAIAKVRSETDAVKVAVEERRKLLSVTPEFCRIVAMGTARGQAEIRAAIVGEKLADDTVVTEADILASFWNAAEECGPLIGFNVLHFDLPVIFVRSMLLGVKPSRKVDLTPWKGDVVDLMQARYPKGGQRKLKDLARIYGFDIPAGDCDGSDVDRLWREEPAQLAEYVKSDVHITRRLHASYRGTFC